MGPQAQWIYEGVMAGLQLYRALSVEQREPTAEELVALAERNDVFRAQLRLQIEARED